MERLTYVTEKGEVLFHPKDLPDDEGMTITQLAEDGRFKALEQIAEILGLDDNDKQTMYNLAGKKRDSVAPDLPDYIMKRDYVAAALRTARDLDAGEEEWLQFVKELKERKG